MPAMQSDPYTLQELVLTLTGIFAFEALLLGTLFWFNRKERLREDAAE